MTNVPDMKESCSVSEATYPTFFGTNKRKLRQRGRKSYLSCHSNRQGVGYRWVASSIYIYLLMIYLTTFSVAHFIRSLRCCVCHWIMNGKVWVRQRSRPRTLRLSFFIGNITRKKVRVRPHIILQVFHAADINKFTSKKLHLYIDTYQSHMFRLLMIAIFRKRANAVYFSM